MNKDNLHFLNGRYVEDKDLLISPNDLGFARGYALFDFFVTYQGGKPFKLDDHTTRLYRSIELMGLSFLWTPLEIKNWVLETIAKNKNGKEKVVKIMVSAGVSNSMMPESDPTVVITCYDRVKLPEALYEVGVDLLSVKHTRELAEAKTNNYIEAVKQTQIAKKKGAFMPLYYDDSQVFEASNANIFALIDGELQTPKNNILEGITRKVLLKLVDGVVERDFSMEELMNASEAFITGSNVEILPVTKIDGENIGDGKVGDVTTGVMSKFKKFTESAKW